MASDRFGALYARYPVDVPTGQEIYKSTTKKILLLAGSESRSHLVEGTTQTAGEHAARKTATGILSTLGKELSIKSPTPSPWTAGLKADLVLGVAAKAMEESDNRIISVSGRIFGLSMKGYKVYKLLGAANPIGVASLIAWEICNSTDDFIKWKEDREEARLSREYDRVLLHWSATARRAKKAMESELKRLRAIAKSPQTFSSSVASAASKAYAGTNDATARGQINAIHSLARASAIDAMLDQACSAFSFQELATLLQAFFEAAQADPENGDLLGVPSGYKGKVDDGRTQLFQIYASWFRKFGPEFSELRRTFEAYAAIFAFMTPADLAK